MSCAVANANLDVFEREDLCGHVLANEGRFKSLIDGLRDIPLVGDVRGDGYFLAIELVTDQASRGTFDDDGRELAAARVPVATAVRSGTDLPRRRSGRTGDHPRRRR